MAIDTAALKAQLNKIGDLDEVDAVVLPRLLAAAQRKIEADLGYALSDTSKLPDGAPPDLELAVLMTAADWYENRTMNLVGVSAQPLPFGVAAIVANYRDYSFGGMGA